MPEHLRLRFVAVVVAVRVDADLAFGLNFVPEELALLEAAFPADAVRQLD